MSALNDTGHPYRPAKSQGANPSIQRHLSVNQNKVGPSNHLPQRYSVKNTDTERVLICLEAPNLNVHIDRKLSISGSIARKSPAGTIFLDGVAHCEPFMDHERQIYNFDHHEGCVRSFTLSCCEQTLVMYMKGLDLQGREWNIFANEPDLDTVLATWILLNHTRIGGMEAGQRRILFALVRYEGVIDALGLELKELSALPRELMRKIQRVIDHLRSDEIRLKKEGRWLETDYLNYTVSILHKIDQIFYKASDFVDYKGIEELARVDLNDQRIAAVVEADMGIYEIEPHLNKLYGNRLGVVFLKKDNYAYTVRQTDLFMPMTLEGVYERLNFIDPAVKNRTKANKWGGADDIGGSPRDTGTRLKPADIAQGCRDAIQKLKPSQQIVRFLITSALVTSIVLIAALVRMYWDPVRWLQAGSSQSFWADPDFGLILTLWITISASLYCIAGRIFWQYGLMRPTGTQWWWFIPLALICAIAGGVWTPKAPALDRTILSTIITGIIGMPIAAELLFRSLVHGLFSQTHRIQRDDSRWFVSWPAILSSVLYAGFILVLIYVYDAPSGEQHAWRLGIALPSALVFGITMAMVRERSQSILPPILFHIISAVAALTFQLFS